MWVVRLLFALALNAIPLYGIRYLGWSASTVVVLYWFENLAIAVFTCARIALHRKLTRKRGHFRAGTLGTNVGDKPSTQGLLGEYAILAFVFTLAHGVFVAGFVAIAADTHRDQPIWQFSRLQFEQGAQWMLLALALEFLLDATTLRNRSFAWLKAYVGQRTGRVLIMHFTIILGMGAMMATESPYGMLYVLIGLKTLWDVFASKTSAQAADVPQEPPRWAIKLANTADKKGGAHDMSKQWARTRENMIRAAQEDEEVMPA